MSTIVRPLSMDLGTRHWVQVFDTDVRPIGPKESLGARLLRERRLDHCAAMDRMMKRAGRSYQESVFAGDEPTVARFSKEADDFEAVQIATAGILDINHCLDWQAGSIPLGGWIAPSTDESRVETYPEIGVFPLWAGSTAGHGIVLVEEADELAAAVKTVVAAAIGPHGPPATSMEVIRHGGTTKEQIVQEVFDSLPRPFKGEMNGDDRLDGMIVLQPVAAIAWQGFAEVFQGVRFFRRLSHSLAGLYRAPAEMWAMAAIDAAHDLWATDQERDAVQLQIHAAKEWVNGEELDRIIREGSHSYSRPEELRGYISEGLKIELASELRRRLAALSAPAQYAIENTVGASRPWPSRIWRWPRRLSI